jgi:hypothetical protein
MTLRKRRLILVFASLVFLIVAPALLLYAYGYRLDSHFRISKTGGLYISSPVSGSEIFVENNFKKLTNILQPGLFLQNLSEGEYQILVAKEGYWPWLKTLNIKESQVAEARAFLISQNPEGKVLLRGRFKDIQASPYNKVLLLEEEKNGGRQATFYLPDTNTFLTPVSATTTKLLFFKNGVSKISWDDNSVLLADDKTAISVSFDFENETVNALPASIKEIVVNDKYEKFAYQKKEHLFWDNKTNSIWLEWLGAKDAVPYYICESKPCESTNYLIAAFASSAVKNADFFPTRRDLLIIAAQNGVFAFEIDERGGRLSQPIYKGKEPTFAVFPNEKKVYVLDNDILLEIDLD